VCCVDAWSKEVIQKQGRIDVLVLNAGLGGGNLSLDQFVDLKQHHYVMDTNYWGCVTPTFHALSHLKASHGQIIAVSSLSAIVGTPGRTGYSPTKAALNNFFDCLRLELNGTVSVTVVCPGYVHTEIHDSMLKKQNLKRNMNKFMTAHECAQRIIESGYNGDALLLMTLAGQILQILLPFLPQSIMDRIVSTTSTSAFSLDESQKLKSS